MSGTPPTDDAPSGVPPLVAEDHVCAECGLAYARIGIDDALETLAGLPARVRAAAIAIPEPWCRRRPDPSTWSVVEYVCHIRDVFVVSTIRLHRARKEREPVTEPMLNDLRARRFRYNDRALVPTLDELAASVDGFRDEIHRCSETEWERTIRRQAGEIRSARWLVRQATHEGVHHLRDIETVGARVAQQG